MKSYKPCSGSLPQVLLAPQRDPEQDQQRGCNPWHLCHPQCHSHCRTHSGKVGDQQPPVPRKASGCSADHAGLRQYVQTCGHRLDWNSAAGWHSTSVNINNVYPIPITILLITAIHIYYSQTKWICLSSTEGGKHWRRGWSHLDTT